MKPSVMEPPLFHAANDSRAATAMIWRGWCLWPTHFVIWAAHAASQRSVATLARWALQTQAEPSQPTLYVGDLPEAVGAYQCWNLATLSTAVMLALKPI